MNSKVTPYVFIDTREKLPLRFKPELNVDCGTAKLDAGDYSVRGYSSVFIAERKSLSDLVQTLSHGRERFESELDLLAQYRWPVILVEANQTEAEIGAYRSMMLPHAVTGSLDAIWMRWGVPTFWCGDAAGAARKLAWFAHRLHRKYPELEEKADVSA